MEKRDYLISCLSQNEIPCTDIQADKLIRFYEMLIEKNKVMNLTAITDYEDVVVKHFADSLTVNRIIDLSSQRLIDVGTGAGFPGIPLKIIYPDLKVTLLDSLNKRLVFLNEVIDELGLKGIETVHYRAEEAARLEKYRENYDVVVSRAVANLSTLVEYCLPFASVGGCFISYKGEKAQEEVDAASTAIRVLGGKLSSAQYFTLNGSSYDRALIRIDKVSYTLAKYPRQGGKPSSSPIT